MKDFFTNADIQELAQNPSEYVKLGLIGKIASGFVDKLLSDTEKAVAGDILRLLAQDISSRIRMNISEKFCTIEDIPYDVVKQLADDIEDLVAIPMVQFSSLLTEQDLIEIVQKDKDGKQRAVARRENLSNKLVDEIITHGNEHTVEALIDSNAEKISKSTSERIINKFSNNASLIGELININKVNPEVAQDLLSMLSNDLREQITHKYKIPILVVDSILATSQESVSYSLLRAQINQATSTIMLESLIAKLIRDKHLSLNLILRVLATGNINFFAHALGKLAAVPAKNIEALLNEEGKEGVVRLFEKIHFPTNLASATKELYLITKSEVENQPNTDVSESVSAKFEETLTDSSDTYLGYVLNILKSS